MTSPMSSQYPKYVANSGFFAPLPQELLEHTLSFLDPSEREPVSRTCHRLNDAVWSLMKGEGSVQVRALVEEKQHTYDTASTIMRLYRQLDHFPSRVLTHMEKRLFRARLLNPTITSIQHIETVSPDRLKVNLSIQAIKSLLLGVSDQFDKKAVPELLEVIGEVISQERRADIPERTFIQYQAHKLKALENVVQIIETLKVFDEEIFKALIQLTHQIIPAYFAHQDKAKFRALNIITEAAFGLKQEKWLAEYAEKGLVNDKQTQTLVIHSLACTSFTFRECNQGTFDKLINMVRKMTPQGLSQRIFFVVAENLARRGQYQRAITLLNEENVKTYRYCSGRLKQISAILANAGDLEGALAFAQETVPSNQRAQAIDRIAKNYARSGEIQEAIETATMISPQRRAKTLYFIFQLLKTRRIPAIKSLPAEVKDAHRTTIIKRLVLTCNQITKEDWELLTYPSINDSVRVLNPGAVAGNLFDSFKALQNPTAKAETLLFALTTLNPCEIVHKEILNCIDQRLIEENSDSINLSTYSEQAKLLRDVSDFFNKNDVTPFSEGILSAIVASFIQYQKLDDAFQILRDHISDLETQENVIAQAKEKIQPNENINLSNFAESPRAAQSPTDENQSSFGKRKRELSRTELEAAKVARETPAIPRIVDPDSAILPPLPLLGDPDAPTPMNVELPEPMEVEVEGTAALDNSLELDNSLLFYTYR